MIKRSKTIFSNSPLPPTTETIETKKTSYWLEKLFSQREKRVEDENQEKFANRQRALPSSTKPSGIETVLQTQAEKQTSEKKGLEEAVKNYAGKAETNRQAVEDMVNNSNRILLKISSVFPWDFFPTSIIAEETRLTIIHRQLLSSQAYSVDIKNISNIFIDTSILFAQLTIVSSTFAQNQIIISRLWKKEAIFMRRIIEGLRMFVDKDIDTTTYEVKELINKLRELSTTGIIL